MSPLRLGAALFDALVSSRGAREALRAHLRERFGAERVVLTGSGTQALQRALVEASSSPTGTGRPVALPGYTCYDVATAAVGADVQVLFYDIDPESLQPDVDSLRSALAAGAGTVVVNSLYGFPVNWTDLRTECAAAGAVLVEDAAQGLGSSWADVASGAQGDLTVLSFGRGKGWTGGMGGALLVHAAAEALGVVPGSVAEAPPPPASASLRAVAVGMAQWALGRPRLFWIPSSIPALALGETVYKEPSSVTGLGGAPAAAVLRHSAPASREVERRRTHGARWRALVEEVGAGGGGGVRPCRPDPGGECGYLRFPALAPASLRERLMSGEGGRFGVIGGYPKPLCDVAPLASRQSAPGCSLPGAREIADSLVTLPTHSHVREVDFQGVRNLLGAASLSG